MVYNGQRLSTIMIFKIWHGFAEKELRI